jgi:YVTN family beta-propeller protein
VWAVAGDRIAELDPATAGEVRSRSTEPAAGLSHAGGALWQVSSAVPEAYRLGADLEVVATVALSGLAQPPVSGGEGLWFSDDSGTVSLVSPETNDVEDSIEVGGQPLRGTVDDETDSLWVAVRGEQPAVVRIDTGTGETSSASVGATPDIPTVVAGSAWVSVHGENAVVELEAAPAGS